jgi:hypothetical protein
MMSEDESIEMLCPVCRQPMDADEEVAECINPMCSVYELETGTWYAITRHIELMQGRLNALEALSKQAHITALMSESEWEALTQQSRHRVNVFAQDAEKLAGLCLVQLAHPDADYRAEIGRLARLLAPDAPPDTPLDASENLTGEEISEIINKTYRGELFELAGSASQTGEPDAAHFVPVDSAIIEPSTNKEK